MSGVFLFLKTLECSLCYDIINSEDLKNRDFSKILYNWDCC
ncbi:MAG: DUF1963 domain-containing protein [Lachnospiraceae bacterium]|nr:DUF1963 domain-containing protein [Lachnospiraceae bacterium]MDE6232175.1 DUF1963 domain-containing protein [Lachnospiraceae bacterium]MDE6254413.1 DUF1963 domain-containing protein [Lachnospiraceae bacterium]